MRAPVANSWISALAATALVAILGWWLVAGEALEGWYAAFILLAGLCTGSLGLLMIGHLMSEEWLTPTRSEAEAAALTAPLLIAAALPLAFSLGALFPWATAATDLPSGRAAYLSTPFFLARGFGFLLLWALLALWITRAQNLRRASAIGLALLAPTATFAAMDWVLAREPHAWFSLFGFAFALSQLLAALAGSILISLLRPEHPNAVRMQSLERALLTLALLVLWTWFTQFLIVWLGNLPNEAAWYVVRMDPVSLTLLAVAVGALIVAVAILVPPGFGRGTMIAGSALLLVSHIAHMLWLLGQGRPERFWSLASIASALALIAVWGAWFVVALRARPTFAAEKERGAET